ncbi:conserved hypothetical protein [Cupriavidus taiwanensis]|uniref:Uncharacterized protein n=1 Tax=Cupriavidus taiwanensis TaxID=164546 RepID=A0A375DX15_9BURK|nr:conserved hypothetical protein [Cupriavidus taiwanensis]SOZ52217.1 conserved hypothetical protein [Cupriavidus taiwanensis]SOZ54782.1 conserved hypothetical protein [Cupriavidus taiwanensis]SPA04363.1 conserved hypothetical protein [Cupriavidus taiwanensis]
MSEFFNLLRGDRFIHCSEQKEASGDRHHEFPPTRQPGRGRIRLPEAAPLPDTPLQRTRPGIATAAARPYGPTSPEH